jgi:YjjG family noncanonical pyrimidine nucleotidase
MRKYEWVLFDADDTLLDFSLAERLAFSAMLREFGILEEETHFPVYKSCNSEAWRAYEKGDIDAVTLRGKRFSDFKTRAALQQGLDPFAMNKSYLNNLIKHTTPIEGALELLQTLRAHRVKMAVITNGLKEVQRPRIQESGMSPFFEFIVVSDEIGSAKPDARFFAHAYAAMRFPEKQKVLVVGDSFTSDIAGARNFELPSCWLNPGSLPFPGNSGPDYEIRSLENLRDIVLSGPENPS